MIQILSHKTPPQLILSVRYLSTVNHQTANLLIFIGIANPIQVNVAIKTGPKASVGNYFTAFYLQLHWLNLPETPYPPTHASLKILFTSTLIDSQ